MVKWLVICVIAGCALGGGWWSSNRSRAEAPQYQTAQVTRGNITQTVTATGQAGPVLNVQVGSQISGTIKSIFADYNSVVKSNQVIALIDPSTYQINVSKAEAQLANSKANLALAKAQAERADSLITNRLIAASDYDIAVAQRDQAAAQVQSDEAALSSARGDLSRCTIYAPVDGVVLSRNL